jgi:hypothetical protein
VTQDGAAHEDLALLTSEHHERISGSRRPSL